MLNTSDKLLFDMVVNPYAVSPILCCVLGHKQNTFMSYVNTIVVLSQTIIILSGITGQTFDL